MSIIVPFLTLLVGVFPAVHLFISKQIIDTLVQIVGSTSTDSSVSNLVMYVSLALFVKMMSVVIGQSLRFTESLFQKRLVGHLQQKVLAKATSLDLACFESPAFYDQLQRAQREVGYRPYGVLASILLAIQQSITVISCFAILATYSLWVIPIVFFVMLPSLYLQTRQSQARWSMIYNQTAEDRKLQYFQDLMTNQREAKELRVFGLTRYLLDSWKALFDYLYRKEKHIAVRYALAIAAAAIAQTLVGMGFYVLVIRSAVIGTISIGAVVMLTQGIDRCLAAMSATVQSLSMFYENNLFLSNLLDFFKQEPVVKEPDKPASLPDPIQGRLQLANVTFNYPGTTRHVLRNLNLVIEPGMRVALVGENGAGKSTIVKLLSRLYVPQVGMVCADGIDLRTVSSREWQSHISVIFQDFAQYLLTVRENIGFGDLNNMHDEQRLNIAADNAGASSIIQDLPNGWDSILGRMFDGGHELSLGQWQRVALARAFFSSAEVFILDEPTASLDAKEEYELFKRFERLTRGKTTILISHRLSNVRMVDRIFFLEAGEIIESGSHEELMAKNGAYANMFQRQASSYGDHHMPINRDSNE